MERKDSSNCYCTVCGGAAKLPAVGTRPPAYPHEVNAPPSVATAAALPVVVAPAPRAAPVPPVVLSLSVEEKIAKINARTDIGAGMKRMQIGNLIRKHGNV